MIASPVTDFKTGVDEGLIGKFAGVPERRLAFWFTIFEPMLIMSGNVAVMAVTDGNLALLRVVSSYLLVISVIGSMALPKSPFTATIFLSAFILVGTLA